MRNNFPFYVGNGEKMNQKDQGWGNTNKGENKNNMGNKQKPPIPFNINTVG